MKIPALKKIKEDLQAKYPFIKSIEKDESPTKAVDCNFISVLKNGESGINGEEYQKRVPKNVLGLSQAVWLLEHQDKFPELKELLGKVYIDFPATIVVDARGYRDYPCLNRLGKRWTLHWYWIGYGFDSRGRIAVSGKSATRNLGNLDSSVFGRLDVLEKKMSKLEKIINL